MRKTCLATLLLTLSFSRARAGQTRMTVPETHAAAEEVIRLVSSYYLFPEKRPTIADALKSALASNRYDTESPEEFADRITSDLRAAGRDGHLYVNYDPEVYQDLLLHGDDETGTSARAREIGRRRNQGFEDLRILDENIRYVRITNFLWTNDSTGRVIDEVARFLADADAVIIDLRGNGGGDPSAVARLISYFFSGSDQTLISFDDRLRGQTTVNRVDNDLPNPRMAGKPLYVLVDAGTASAAEEFAYHVQQFKLGVLVGQNTAGAANRNKRFPVAPGFVASVSIGKPTHPVSLSNWEAVGIAPEIPTPAAAALDRAEVVALQRLLERVDSAKRYSYEWPMATIQARLDPPKPSASDLQAFVGVYGIRSVRLEHGKLLYQRAGSDATTLIPMAPDLFAFANTSEVRVRFRRSHGNVVGFDQITVDGQVVPSERTR